MKRGTRKCIGKRCEVEFLLKENWLQNLTRLRLFGQVGSTREYQTYGNIHPSGGGSSRPRKVIGQGGRELESNLRPRWRRWYSEEKPDE